MDEVAKHAASIVFIGIGATVLLDVWMMVLKALKIPALNFALLGRWVGHVARGKWKHERIGNAWPIRGELLLGWVTHYAIGMVFAALLVLITGAEWFAAPSLMPAVLTGIATVAAPLFIMQPAMGAGVAFTRTPTPIFNCLKSLVNHGVFGAGLYLTAAMLAWL